jgi:betaine-aldehyde dehydrogenase
MIVFELMEEVGFPKGVINLILSSGEEVGDTLSGHKEVDLCISYFFTTT